jgi:hypothetical protein
METATGILTSQVGYEAGDEVVVLFRSPDEKTFAGHAARLHSPGGGGAQGGGAQSGGAALPGPVPLGTHWGSHYARLALGRLAPGEYRVQVAGHTSDPFDVGDNILWQSTFHLSAIDQLERRARFAESKLGWMDAGMPWFECNAHASMLLALADVLAHADARLTPEQRQRLIAQAVNGADYLCLLQDEAARRGKPAGSLSHQVPRFEEEAIPADASKSAAAWAALALTLPDSLAQKKTDYHRRAIAALRYVLATPCDNQIGFNRKQRGLPETYTPPQHQPLTRDLLMSARAATLLAQGGWSEGEHLTADLLRRVLSRQATPAEKIHGFHGHFFEFDDRHHAEPAWAHQIMGRPLGVDAGASHGYDVLPLLDAARAFPNHPDAPRWLDSLRSFAEAFLIPACSANPFSLVPHLLHREHGLIHFAGPWHGMNCIYGQAATTLFRLHREMNLPTRPHAVGNLQWLCGLNAGITTANVAYCHLFSADIPPGRALPASLIYGVGRRTAGGWLTLRGSVCNGFSVGEQFKFDTDVSPTSDGPFSLSDEDWIPHAAGLVSALVCM